MDAEEREQIRELQKRKKMLSSLHPTEHFSTGINIRNLHNIIFASPSKSVYETSNQSGECLEKELTRLKRYFMTISLMTAHTTQGKITH